MVWGKLNAENLEICKDLHFSAECLIEESK